MQGVKKKYNVIVKKQKMFEYRVTSVLSCNIRIPRFNLIFVLSNVNISKLKNFILNKKKKKKEKTTLIEIIPLDM